MAQPASDGPVRPLRPAHRALTGVVALKGQGKAGFESSLERDLLVTLDFDWRVTRIREQPFTLTYVLGSATHRYTPDVLADFHDSTRRWTVVYEVKDQDDLRANWLEQRPRYKAAVAYCRSRGWRFRIVTQRQLRTPYLDNAKFLRRYRGLPIQHPHYHALLANLQALGPTTVQALLLATWWDRERQLSAIPELWRMVANHEVGVCLTEPLTMNSTVWLP